MESQRLRLKIGDYEFEAEGPYDVVQAQYKAFQELVLKVMTAAPAPQINVSADPQTPKIENVDQKENDNNGPDASLDEIMILEDKIVSLTTSATDIDEAVLLLMYGQKTLRDNVSVSGVEIMEGLRRSGRNVQRVDRNLEKAGDAGNLIVIGQRRAKRYRLTNKGNARARAIAVERINEVA